MLNFAQIGLSNSLIQGVAFDPSYQAGLNRITELGGVLPSTTWQAKGNKLISTLKDLGRFSTLDRLLLLATDGDDTCAYLNWVNPSSTPAQAVNTVSLTTSGMAGNGTNSYVNSNFIPSLATHYLLDNAEVIIYYSSTTESTSMFDGSRNASNQGLYWNIARTSTTTDIRVNTSVQLIVNHTPGPGLYFFGRSDSANAYLRYNNGSLLTAASASQGLSTVPITLGALNSNGSFGNFSDRRIGVFAAGASNTAIHADVHAAIMEYVS